MSLLHDKLKKLEQERLKKERRCPDLAAGLRLSMRRPIRINWRWVKLGLGLILGGALIGVGLPYWQIMMRWGKRQISAHYSSAVRPVVVEQQPATTVVAAKLERISLEQRQGRSVLHLELTAPVAYRSERLSAQQLVIFLDQAVLAGNLPVSLENSFIATLDTHQEAKGVTITLLLLPGTVVDELQLIRQPTPHIQLILANPQLTPSGLAKIPVPPTAEELMVEQRQHIEQCLANGRRSEAITQLYRFVGDFPDNLWARDWLAVLLMQEGRWQQAEESLRLSLARYPQALSLIKLQAQLCVRQERIDQALQWLRRHLGLAENDGEYLATLADLYRKQREFMAAADIYYRLTKLEPTRTIWWIGLGLALEEAGKYNGAREAYLRGYNSSEVPSDLRPFLLEKIR